MNLNRYKDEFQEHLELYKDDCEKVFDKAYHRLAAGLVISYSDELLSMLSKGEKDILKKDNPVQELKNIIEFSKKIALDFYQKHYQ